MRNSGKEGQAMLATGTSDCSKGRLKDAQRKAKTRQNMDEEQAHKEREAAKERMGR